MPRNLVDYKQILYEINMEYDGSNFIVSSVSIDGLVLLSVIGYLLVHATIRYLNQW